MKTTAPQLPEPNPERAFSRTSDLESLAVARTDMAGARSQLWLHPGRRDEFSIGSD
ncbi:MAG: hypothetical protein U0S48_10595 [Solirubrobacteraceae bacterium]